MSMGSVTEVVYRLRRLPPRRVPGVVGRYAWRVARARARRWQLQRTRGEISDSTFQKAIGPSTPEEIFDAFLRRFFADPTSARQTALAVKQAYPQHAERTRTAADLVVEHVFDLLGSGPVKLGPRIDWQLDFKTGIGWPADVLADDLEGIRTDDPSDIKVPWELSRCHHWVTLGRAYAMEGDPRYAAEFAGQLDAWLSDNPWPCGANWSRAMEVAVRAVNWLWAAALFADAPQFTPALKRRFLKAMLQHGNHILQNLEYAGTNGNHYLSNGVGLLFLGVLLSELAPAAAWRRKGFEIVWGEMHQQVHPDGVDFEQGIGYQGLVCELWYSCVLLCDRNHVTVPALVRERLERMFDFMLAYTRPDGTFPQIGDNDDGRLAGLDDEPVGSHRRHLAVGGAMFKRDDLLAAAGDAVETAVWLCGRSVLALPHLDPSEADPVLALPRSDQSEADPVLALPRSQPPEVDRMLALPPEPSTGPKSVLALPPRASAASTQASRGFSDGGFYIMRSPDTVMVIDAAEVGMRGLGGHGHNDVLSFDLWAAGAGVLVDSGTFTYSADLEARQQLRSTAAHNALRVDGEETSRLGSGRRLWLIENDAQPFGVEWSSNSDRDVLQASHTGYRRLPEPVDHTRRITFDKHKLTWQIEDVVDGRGRHLVELFFHPGVPFEAADRAVRLCAPRGDVWLFPPSETTANQEAGWISRGYGLREPAEVLVYALRASVPIRLRTDLVLVPSGTPVEVARSKLEPD